MCMIMAVLLLGAAVHADLQFVDNFEAATTHIDADPTAGGGAVWDTSNGTSGNIVRETINASNVIRVHTTTSGDGRGFGFSGIDNTIDDTQKGIVFFRFSVRVESQAADSYLGLHEMTTDTPFGTGQKNNPENYINAGFRLFNGAGSTVNVVRTRDISTVLMTGLVRGQWYNCWIEADNANDTFDLYISQAAGPAGAATLPTPADKIADDLSFDIVTSNPLTGAYYCCPTNTSSTRTTAQSARLYIDEVYWDGDQGLASMTAHKPNPAKGAVNVPIEQALSWEAPDSPDIAEVLGYDVYLDPNQTKVANRDPSVLRSAAQTETSYDPTPDVLFDTVYYWAVDTMVTLVDDPNDPKTSVEEAGSVWSFRTRTPAPIVTGDPVDTLADINGSASFTVIVNSPYATESYQWYSSADRSSDTAADDVLIIGAASATYTNSNVALADEKYYYCSVSNVYNSVTYTVKSNAAVLAVKRKVAHWKLDALVGGQYEDSSGEGHHADPNAPVDFPAGQNPAVTNQGATVNPDGGWANAGTWNPSELSKQLTLSMWVKWNGQPMAPRFQGLMGKRSVFASNMLWQLEIGNNTASLLTFKSNIGNGVSSPILPVGQWEQVVVTYDGTTATIYRNGTFAATGSVPLPSTGSGANLMIGACGLDPATPNVPTSILDGVLDDVQIYNYVLDPLTIAYAFTDVDGQGRSACLDPRDPILVAYDLDGNCEIGLGDLIDLAAYWLEGQLVPDVVGRP